LKHGVFFVRLRAIGEKELLAQVQCSSLHSDGLTQPQREAIVDLLNYCMCQRLLR
jgi:hypothetical protein